MLVPPPLPPPLPPPEPATWPRNSTNCTLLIVAPAGTLPATLNSINPRRGEPVPFVPENMPGPPPLLLLTLFWKIVLDLTSAAMLASDPPPIVIVAAEAEVVTQSAEADRGDFQ